MGPQGSANHGCLIFWLVLVPTVVAALHMLNLAVVSEPVSQFLNLIVAFLPKLSAAATSCCVSKSASSTIPAGGTAAEQNPGHAARLNAASVLPAAVLMAPKLGRERVASAGGDRLSTSAGLSAANGQGLF